MNAIFLGTREIYGNIELSSELLLLKYRKELDLKNYSANEIKGKKVVNEIIRLRSKLNLEDEAFMKKIIDESIIKFINKLLSKHQYKIPLIKIKDLKQLQKNGVEIVKVGNHDYLVDLEKKKIILNINKIGQGLSLEMKTALILASIPNQVMRFLIRMLKNEKNIKEEMIFKLKTGEEKKSLGMVGWILNEGYIEMMTRNFCIKNNIYYSPIPKYHSFSKLCENISSTYNIKDDDIFKYDYEDICKLMDEELVFEYKSVECLYFLSQNKINGEQISLNKVKQAYTSMI